MRVYVKIPNQMTLWIPVPNWLLKFGCGFGSWIVVMVKKYATSEEKQYVDAIDFAALRESIDMLSQYKGMNIVEVVLKDGTKVHIRA